MGLLISIIKEFKRSIIKSLLAGAILSTLLQNASAEDTSVKKKTPVLKTSMSMYYDTRKATTSTFTIRGGGPFKTDIFGFCDFSSKFNKPSFNEFFDPSYLELRINKEIGSYFEPKLNGLGLALEHNRNIDLDSNLWRFGISYKKSFKTRGNNGFIFAKLYPIGTNEAGPQVGVYASLPISKNPIFPRGGYVENNAEYNSTLKKWLDELQIGWKINDNINFVVESRFNGFLPKRDYGIGFGLEYQF